MKLNEVKNLLDSNGLEYKVSRVESSREYYFQQGFQRSKKNYSFKIITIFNPNHGKHIELIFDSDEENPNFCDLDFGGYSYERVIK